MSLACDETQSRQCAESLDELTKAESGGRPSRSQARRCNDGQALDAGFTTTAKGTERERLGELRNGLARGPLEQRELIAVGELHILPTRGTP